ncbi:MAG: hypothetical protein Fur0040_03890 [Sideroxydans sp.]
MLPTRHILLALSLVCTSHGAHASSCNPDGAKITDVYITEYQEAECARHALDNAAQHLHTADRAQSMSNTDAQCDALYHAVLELDPYRNGSWRESHHNVSDKVDTAYASILDRFLKSSCPQQLALLHYLANQGEAWAMHRIGLAYLNGTGVAQSDDQALTWLQLAAEKDYAPACLSLGQIYSDGAAFPPDWPTAFAWYNKAAQLGDAEAQYRVAGLYRRGVGTARDLKLAAELYKKAAAQKHAGAKAMLEEMYRTGEAKKSFW